MAKLQALAASCQWHPGHQFKSDGPLEARERFCCAVELPQQLREGAYLLVLGLRRDYLTDYEFGELCFFASDLGRRLRAHEHVQNELQDLPQVRHALRAGLAGVIGHGYVAVKISRRLQQPDVEVSEYRRAKLRKAVLRTYLSAAKTMNLLEGARLLLKEIDPGPLRLGSYPVSSLVREVVQSLTPDAGQRRLQITFVNQMGPEIDEVVMDRQMVDMMVFNVIENAVKYSHRTYPITVKLFPRHISGVDDGGTGTERDDDLSL